MPRKRIICFIAAFLVAQLFGLVQGSFLHKEAYASEVYDETVTLEKVSYGGQELERKFDESINLYYYDIPRSESSVELDFFIDNLHTDTIYMIGDSEFTSDDNGKISTVTLSPWPMYLDSEYLLGGGIISYVSPSLQVKHQQEFGYSTEYLYSIDSLYFKSSTLGTDSISLISISQNGVELDRYLNGFKTTDYVSPISVTYEIENLPLETSFYTYANLYGSIGANNGNSNRYATSETESFTSNFELGLGDPTPYLSISYSYGSNHYENLQFPVVIDNPSYVPLGDLYINNIEYNGDSIEPRCDEYQCVFDLNDVYDYAINIYTDQAMEDAEYTFTYNRYYPSVDDASYNGLDLKNGVALHSIGYNGQYHGNYVAQGVNIHQLGSQQKSFYYIDESGSKLSASLRFAIDPNIPRITSAEIKYANMLDKAIYDYGVVDIRYHDADNPLAINIKGESFDINEEYDIDVLVYKTHSDGSNDLIYDEEFEINGADINAGKIVQLDGLVLELEEELLAKDGNRSYLFVVRQNGQKYMHSTNYGFDGAERGNVVAYAKENPNEELLFRVVFGTAGYTSYVTQNDFILHYSVPNLPSNYRFDYEVYKYDSGFFENVFNESAPVYEGTLTGDQILNGELSFEAEAGYSYGIVIKYDGYIINWNAYSFSLSDGSPALYSIMAYSNGAVLPISHYQTSVYDVLMGESVSFTLHGFGFDDDTIYSITPYIGYMGFSMYQGGGTVEPYEDLKMDFTGKELNDGTAVITVPFYEEFGSQANIDNWSPLSYGYRTISFAVDDTQLGGVEFAYSNRKFSTKLLGEDNIIDGEISLYLSVDDFKHFNSESSGIAGLVGDIEYDSDMLELVSVEGQNGFEIETGEHYVLHDTAGLGVPAGTTVMKLNFRNIGLARDEETIIKFTNITGSDGFNDIRSEDISKTISIYNPTPVIENMPFNLSNNILSKVSTGTTVESFRSQVILGGFASLRFITADEQEMESTDKIGTGVKIQLLNYYSEVADEYTVKIKGDINGDGEITITDLVKAKRHLAASSGATLTGVYADASDITGSGSIGITDIVKICRHIAQVEAIVQ